MKIYRTIDCWIPSLIDKSTTQFLYLRDIEHHVSEDRNIVKTGEPGSWL